MTVGDLVRFSREHISLPGLDYCKDWIGVIIEYNSTMQILWTIRGDSHIMKYDEGWSDSLNYEPFEVVYESR